jgi:hypothetical protein
MTFGRIAVTPVSPLCSSFSSESASALSMSRAVFLSRFFYFKTFSTEETKPNETSFCPSIHSVFTITPLEFCWNYIFEGTTFLKFFNKTNFSLSLPEALQQARIHLFFASCTATG